MFSRNEALHPVIEQPTPFGICIHCRLSHSQSWGLRVALESTLYDQNSFITLTYSPQNLPKHGLLDYNAPVLFMKRLREEFGEGIRSFGCAEYGEKFSRPHYHLCLLNFDFPDKKILGTSKANWGKLQRENPVYSSEILQRLWPSGHTTLGTLTLESASYVARYCTKKITGKDAPYHYDFVEQQYGEIIKRPPERLICASRARGLGFPYYERFGEYIRNHDRVNFGGRTYPVPKYFDSLTQKIDPDRFEEIKEKRRLTGAQAIQKIKNDAAVGGVNIEQRIRTMEQHQMLSFKLLKRTIENV